MIGRILCFIGLHQWWPYYGHTFTMAGRTVSNPGGWVCGRCPAKRYRQ